jgi:hypothetical protein
MRRRAKLQLRTRAKLTPRDTIRILRILATDYEARAARAVDRYDMELCDPEHTMKAALWYTEAARQLRGAIAVASVRGLPNPRCRRCGFQECSCLC